ncbi:MAG: hypothetical protein NTZ09_19905 [Candidatus Hydrogenedentes bacterium]|nr:hypothetical protein [Candidatus Hydrogenedentota bacterium]
MTPVGTLIIIAVAFAQALSAVKTGIEVLSEAADAGRHELVLSGEDWMYCGHTCGTLHGHS